MEIFVSSANMLAHAVIRQFGRSFIQIKGPLKYLLMPLLGKNQFAITLHMCASTGPNLDNSHKELKWISA